MYESTYDFLSIADCFFLAPVVGEFVQLIEMESTAGIISSSASRSRPRASVGGQKRFLGQ